MNAPPHSNDRRLLVLTPTQRDAAITRSILDSSHIAMALASDVTDLVAEMKAGVGAVLVPEEALTPEDSAKVAKFLRDQPPWSDVPILVLTRHGADSEETAEALRSLGNVTLLERPVRISALVSAIATAMRARDRQYQIRGYLQERAAAEVALRTADQRKDEFLATLGHELRNPLAPLLTGLHLLKMATVKEPAAVRACAVMERQISHLVRLVDDLLEVSRITRGVIDVRREPLDLTGVIRAAVETSKPGIAAARHTLHLDLPSEPLPISGDSVRLTQVFANLLNNGAKYTNSGGGHIWITARSEGDRAVVTIRDNGIGIDPKNLGSVFEMFTQVDRSNRRTQGGLGIGLTLVRSLVNMHGGTVVARSQGPNTGSEFEVDLPLASAMPAQQSRPFTIEEFSHRRILIVDDNHDAADTLSALLTKLGATVRVAYDGRDGLEKIESFNPDAAILDIGMPGMDGYEIARRIRADGRYDDMLLIALTGWGQETDRRRSRSAGIDHHLVKPPDVAKLKELLATHV